MNLDEMTFDFDRDMFEDIDQEAVISDYTKRNNQQNAETLRRIQQNDTSLRVLQVGLEPGGVFGDGKFNGTTEDGSEYCTLGAAVAINTHLRKLKVHVVGHALTIENKGFFDGIRRNTSIQTLELHCAGISIVDGNVSRFERVAHEILMSYNNLTQLDLHLASFRSGASRDFLCHILRRYTNLTSVTLHFCYIGKNDDNGNGCQALASILEDPNCNIRYLSLPDNYIDIGGVTVIANSLASNTKLAQLNLQNNVFDISDAEGIFTRLLCNTSTINDTYSSNHTLEKYNVTVRQSHAGPILASLLKLNRIANKGHVAIRKILRFHPDIDMSKLFDWDAEDEQTLKALPFVVAWFEKGREAIAELNSIQRESYYIDKRELSAIYQFARTMPLLFVSASHTKVEGAKRKRDGM